MKILAKIIILSFWISNLHAELLIIKRIAPVESKPNYRQFNLTNRSSFAHQSYVAPLDASDKLNYPAIAQILLNYQWPMVIANQNLTSTEKDELFAPIPNNEENFIRRKLQEINPAYDVAFIPTCLYEMFVLTAMQSKSSNNPLSKLYRNITAKVFVQPTDMYKNYRIDNAKAYSEAFFYNNNLLLQELFHHYPIVQRATNGFDLSDKIKQLSSSIAAWIIDKNIPETNCLTFSFDENIIDFNNELSVNLGNTIKSNGIIAQTIRLEYQARVLNKGLLLRGTSMIHACLDKNLSILQNSQIVCGDFIQLHSSHKKSLSRKGSIRPLSISFGNSLLAGYMQDISACVYNYIDQTGVGYGLFINKKDHIEHESHNLFFISPLSSIVALFSFGEMFHSRAKVATKELRAQGFANQEDLLPDAIKVTYRDPIKHEQLLSDYFIKNMSLIVAPKFDPHHNKTSDLTAEEQAIYDQKIKEESDQLKANQRKASDYYGAVKTLKQQLPKATAHYRQYLDDTKSFDQDMQQLEEKYGPVGPEWLD
jgi:hypothetical protein